MEETGPTSRAFARDGKTADHSVPWLAKVQRFGWRWVLLARAFDDRSLNCSPAKLVLREQPVVGLTQNLQVAGTVRPTSRPRVPVMKLQKCTSRTALPVAANEGTAATVTLQQLPSCLLRDMRSSSRPFRMRLRLGWLARCVLVASVGRSGRSVRSGR
jgi:hypothetical protein